MSRERAVELDEGARELFAAGSDRVQVLAGHPCEVRRIGRHLLAFYEIRDGERESGVRHPEVGVHEPLHEASRRQLADSSAGSVLVASVAISKLRLSLPIIKLGVLGAVLPGPASTAMM